MRRILYPTLLDQFGLPMARASRNALLREDRELTLDDLAYAVRELEGKVGIDGSTVATSLDALTAALGIRLTTAEANIVTALALTIQGTANRITASKSGNIVTLSAPQDIHSGASPTFAGLTLSGKVTTYNNVATAQMGLAPILEYVFLEAYDSDTGWVSFANTTTAGLYRVSVYYRNNAFDNGTSTVHVDLRWNGAGQSYTGETLTLSSSAVFKEYTKFIYHTGGANSVQYQADYTQVASSADSFDAHLIIQRLT